MLQPDGYRRRPGIHERTHRRTFLIHVDENLTQTVVRVQPDGDIAFLPTDNKLVDPATPGLREPLSQRLLDLFKLFWWLEVFWLF